MEINKILVPVDFSPCALNALRIAADLAGRTGASLEVINAIHVPAHPHADVMAAQTIVQPMLSEYEAQVEERFQKLAEEVPELSEVTYTTRKFVALPSDAIYTCITEDGIDLVVMGTKGSHDVLEKIIGSLSADVIRFSKVPVLMIPENVEALSLKTIGFAADLHTIEDVKKLEVMIFFAKMTGAEIKLFYFARNDDHKHLLERGREKMKLLDSLAGVKHSYVWSDQEKVSSGIMEMVDTHNLDMLVMYPRNHSLWDRILHGSVTKRVAVRVDVPLLTVHE